MSFTLSHTESAILQEINIARSNPHGYSEVLEKERRPYFEGITFKPPGKEYVLQTREGRGAVDEAISYLRGVPGQPSLKPSYGLSAAALESVKEIGPTGQQAPGHSLKRIDKWGKLEGPKAVELVLFGNADAREQISRLLIGDGDPQREQRNHLYESKWRYIGIAVGEHASSYKQMAILILAEGFYDR